MLEYFYHLDCDFFFCLCIDTLENLPEGALAYRFGYHVTITTHKRGPRWYFGNVSIIILHRRPMLTLLRIYIAVCRDDYPTILGAVHALLNIMYRL